jgi:hypothetical protein
MGMPISAVCFACVPWAARACLVPMPVAAKPTITTLKLRTIARVHATQRQRRRQNMAATIKPEALRGNAHTQL